MASAELLSITNLLEDIITKSERCLKNNDYARILISKISGNMMGSCQSSVPYDHGDDTGSFKVSEELDSLENILFEKLQENSRLKILNDRLQLNSRQKSHKIKELSRILSTQSQKSQKDKEIATYKDEIGKCNVEIQTLKKQLITETKKLHNEKAKVTRLEKNHILLLEQSKSVEISTKKVLPNKKLKRHAQPGSATASFKDLDEVYIQKTLKMINLNGETDINDETLDEPENLDSDEDLKSTDEISKESTDKETECSS